jgi:hypothetical protein
MAGGQSPIPGVSPGFYDMPGLYDMPGFYDMDAALML